MQQIIIIFFSCLFGLSPISSLEPSTKALLGEDVSDLFERNKPKTGLPYNTNQYKELDDLRNQDLQDRLNEIVLSRPRWKKLINNKKLAIGLVDLRDEYSIKYADINGRNMMYAASLPKIAVLLSAMQALKDCTLDMDEQLDKDLRLMIAKSNNAATTRVIERLGFDRIAKTMTDPQYRLYDESVGGGLWVGKKYAKAGKRNPDPLKGLSHAATVEQVCRFYTMLAFGKLVDEEGSAKMMSYLVNPELNHKFVNTLNKIAPGSKIYRKSGTWRNFHSDSVMVDGPDNRRYILVALIQDDNGSAICKRLILDAEKALSINPSKNS